MYKLTKVKLLFLCCTLTTIGAFSVPVQAQDTYIQPYGFATVEKIKSYNYKSYENYQVTLVGKLTAQRTEYPDNNTRKFVFKDNTGEIDVILSDKYDWSDIGGGELIRLSGYVNDTTSYNRYFVATQGVPMNSLVLKCK